jgi:hypothetical protein
MPDHFINIVIRLHRGASIKFKVGETDTEVPSSIGVRQGSCEGPLLFLFIIQAAFETMEWPDAKSQFCTEEKENTGETTAAKWDRKGSAFELWSSFFADDCALLFNSREDLITGANYLHHHLRLFGLLMHIGKGITESKTEAVFFPAPGENHDNGDQSNFTVADGFVSFTTEFKYLGSIIHHTLTSDADVDKRISQASAAFGVLRDCFFRKKDISYKIKGQIYVALVLTVLLYGSECWCLREDLFRRLRTFHNTCVRNMCRVTMRHTIRHRITTDSLLKRLSIQPVDYYYNSRLKRWVGHVARMTMDRLPRKLLTGWVRHKRPKGGPKMTYGRTVTKALKSFGIDPSFQVWQALAQDRDHWRSLTPTHKH